MKTKPTLHLFLLLAAFGCGTTPEPAPVPSTTEGAEASAPAGPDIAGEEVTYKAGDTTLKGFLAWDRSRPGKRPGVIVVHEWWGHNEYARKRARMLAELGYTALAVDMYGDGKQTAHPSQAQTFMQEATRDPAMTKARFDAGLAFLQAHETADATRVAAIGYCFGGAVVLNMARAGVDLDAVASFHGMLGAPAPAAPGATLAKVLVLTGAADPMVPAEQVAGFEREMRQAGASYEVVSYPGALHAFTNPAATEIGKLHNMPVAYDAAADADSWNRLQTLIATTFSVPEPTDAEKAAAREAAKNRGDLARMEAEAAAELARWTPEVHAAARKLAETNYTNVRAGLKAILKGPHRMPGNAERDAQRHPVETLAFFGLKPNMTVFEYGPGAGWYTELLAPLLAAKGKLIVNNGDPNGPPENRGTFYAKRLQLFLDKAPEVYGKVQTVRIADPNKPVLGLDGTLDLALVSRGYHGWAQRDQQGAWLAEIHKALKPKGILAIEQHRGGEGTDLKAVAPKGWLPQKAVIAEVEAAGFKLVASSEINKNPKDTHDFPDGVWALPPTLRGGEKDKEKYLAIGESDRMTLKFVKVEKKAAAPAAAAPAAPAASAAPAPAPAPAAPAPSAAAPAAAPAPK
jgi:predicted methyltransferase/dienelactone hydrolase